MNHWITFWCRTLKHEKTHTFTYAHIKFTIFHTYKQIYKQTNSLDGVLMCGIIIALLSCASATPQQFTNNSTNFNTLKSHTHSCTNKTQTYPIYTYVYHKFIYWNRLELRRMHRLKFQIQFHLTGCFGWNETGKFENTKVWRIAGKTPNDMNESQQ